MDKKNTMLLTVIAVATLLVAVVGATFAYFAITVNGDTTPTNVTGQSGSVATLTYVNGTTNAYLDVTAADMAKPERDTKYYATTNQAITDSTTGGKWIGDGDVVITSHNNEKIINLGGITLSGGGDESYTCTYTITLKKEQDDTMIEALSTQTNDLVLNISGIEDGNYDLSKLANEGSNEKKWEEKFQLTGKDGSSLTNSKTFDATLYLLNSNSKPQQEYLAGKKLKLKFEYNGSCEVDNKNAPDLD